MTHVIDATTVPLDPAAATALASRGLQYRSPDDGELVTYASVINQAFHGAWFTDEEVAEWRAGTPGKRLVGVFDPQTADVARPVGSVVSSVMELTADIGRFLPMWSISDVTVAPTHRRRGIARALVEGELRAAAGAGVPIAGLTVSEATIYERFGFGPAVHIGSWRIDTRRAGWRGLRSAEGSPGRLDAIGHEAIAADLATLNEATRGNRPGDISGWPGLWRALAGLQTGKPDPQTRGVRYTDAAGRLRGVASYSVKADSGDLTAATLAVKAFLADGDEAYAALWQYLLQHDLVGTVTAGLRSLAEPLRWMIADERALTVTERDHQWLRILDVRACLGARRYRVPGSVVFEVTDPLEIADGVWRLDVDAAGDPTVDPVGKRWRLGDQIEVSDAASSPAVDGRVHVGISELSAMLLGNVRASTLRAAGRIACDEATAAWLDAAFLPVAAPQLSYWY